MSANPNRFLVSLLAACVLVAVTLAMVSTAYSAPARVVDTFTATTVNMTPAGLGLRIQILEWQSPEQRAEAVAALAAGPEAPSRLGKLPTAGYVWPVGSPVGYTLKYAHREPAADGAERITLVTDRRLGSYDFRGWSAAPPQTPTDAPYSVIELVVDQTGAGNGTMSLASAVELDEAAGDVGIRDAGAPGLLTNVKRETTRP